jgi:hypothetical protein
MRRYNDDLRFGSSCKSMVRHDSHSAAGADGSERLCNGVETEPIHPAINHDIAENFPRSCEIDDDRAFRNQKGYWNAPPAGGFSALSLARGLGVSSVAAVRAALEERGPSGTIIETTFRRDVARAIIASHARV